eukprot:TRINITY_DN26090_c0_g1_i1.p1 TRINITY_DN26090_c0_g1~~TRINITY_DN26090_c0_g1_i1.p1  ORF type:complete len:333 (+),score=153.62 TRINITY_DN26090_c0_g1_i1:126-1124(+)
MGVTAERVVSKKANLDDFTWSQADEPHEERKRQILAKYGDQIRPLMRPEPLTVPIVVALVSLQLYLAVATAEWSWLPYLVVAYVVGGTINHALFLAIHELVHMLALRSLWGNRIVACIANLPIAVPYSSAFHSYHMEHHRYQGWDGVDSDIPTNVEGRVVQGTIPKLLFCVFQILFYALRPMFLRSPPITTWTAVNWAVQLPVMMALCEAAGSLQPVFYLLLSTFFAGCLHPVSGHFLSEHYEFVDGWETYSYYGPLNVLAFNVGYHNEHHDFPNIPWSRLPDVRRIAPEFYDTIPQTDSWPMTIYRFITDPNMTAFSRVKRMKKGAAKKAM